MENALVKQETAALKLAALMKKDVTVLGNGEIFFLEEAGKTKRAFKVKVELDCPTHFMFITRDKPMVLGEGYDRINQYAGIEIFRPKTVVVNSGETKGNPYFEIDENGAMVSIFLRGIGIGYAPTGNLTAVDQTLYLNLQTLLIQEIQAKIKKFPHLGVLGSRNEKPTKIIFHKRDGKDYDETPTTVDCSGYWYFVPTIRDLGYWVNLSHPEILSAFESFSQKQRFLERTASTILKRLIISAHPAVASKTPMVTAKGPVEYGKVSSGKGYVIVYGFKAESGNAKQRHEDLQGMASKLEAGEKIADMDIVEAEIVDGAEEPETQSPEMVATSPDELPPQEEDSLPFDDEPEAVPQPVESQKEEKPVSPPPPPQEEKLVDYHTKFGVFMMELQKNPEAQKRATDLRAKLKYKSWSDMRKATATEKKEFLDAAKKEGLC